MKLSHDMQRLLKHLGRGALITGGWTGMGLMTADGRAYMLVTTVRALMRRRLVKRDGTLGNYRVVLTPAGEEAARELLAAAMKGRA